MENSWIFFSVCGLIALGLGDWFKQMVLTKGGKKEIFLFWCFVLYCFFIIINFFIQGTYYFPRDLVISGVIIGFLNSFIPISILAAFQYLDRSFALVTLRITSSFLILFVGIFVLGDNLSLYNILGFFLGAGAIFLLSGYRFGSGLKLHWKGLLGLVVAMIGIVLSNSYFKYVVPDVDINNFMLLQFNVSFFFIICYMALRGKFKDMSMQQTKIVLPYAFYSALVFLPQFLYFLPNIYLLGPLSLGYKMLSYSLIVPIILSVIFLGEPVNRIRIIAFVLTIVSIFLFLI